MAKRLELLPFKKVNLDATTEKIDNMVVYNADATKLNVASGKQRFYVFDETDFKTFQLDQKDSANVVVQVTKVALSKDHLLGGDAPASQQGSWNKVTIAKLQ